MRKSSSFRQNYLRRLADLKGSENSRGQALGSLFYDYLETSAEWKPGPTENFKEIYKTARSFLSPINPPRYEMEYAVKKFLSEHGITIKRPHFEKTKQLLDGETGHTAKRHRRRRPKKNKETGV
jgi:poly(A) polymerase